MFWVVEFRDTTTNFANNTLGMMSEDQQCLIDTLKTSPQSDDEEEFTSRHKLTIIDEEDDVELGKPIKRYDLKLDMKFVDVIAFREYIIRHSIQEGYGMNSKGSN